MSQGCLLNDYTGRFKGRGQGRTVEVGSRERKREIGWGSGLPVALGDIRRTKKQLRGLGGLGKSERRRLGAAWETQPPGSSPPSAWSPSNMAGPRESRGAEGRAREPASQSLTPPTQVLPAQALGPTVQPRMRWQTRLKAPSGESPRCDLRSRGRKRRQTRSVHARRVLGAPPVRTCHSSLQLGPVTRHSGYRCPRGRGLPLLLPAERVHPLLG